MTRIAAVASILGFVLALFVFILWPPWDGGGTPGGRRPDTTILTTLAAFTSTSTAALEEMLDIARSVDASSQRDVALGMVASAAVQRGNYEIVIKAAALSPSTSAQSEMLVTVARSAINEALFGVAEDATAQIPGTSVRDSMKLEILKARQRILVQPPTQVVNSTTTPATSTSAQPQ